MAQTPLSVYGMHQTKTTAASILRSAARKEEELAEAHEANRHDEIFAGSHDRNAETMWNVADKIGHATLPDHGILIPGCGKDGPGVGRCRESYFLRLVKR